MQIDLNSLNMLLDKAHEYIHQNPLNGVIISAAVVALLVWLLLKISFGFRVSKLKAEFNKELGAKEQQRVALETDLAAMTEQFHQTEAELSSRNSQIEQLQKHQQTLQIQVDQNSRVKAAIVQTIQDLQTTYYQSNPVSIKAEDSLETTWQNYHTVQSELQQRIKSYEQQNYELKQQNQLKETQLAEQEITLAALKEVSAIQNKELAELQQDFAEIKTTSQEQALKLNSDQQLIEELTQKIERIQSEQRVVASQPILAAAPLQYQEPAQVIVDEPIVEQSIVVEESVPVQVEPLENEASAIISEAIADSAEPDETPKKSGSKFFGAFKKPFGRSESHAVSQEATHFSDEELAPTANVEASPEPVIEPAPAPIQVVAVEIEPADWEEKPAAPVSKLKSFFGSKKTAPAEKDTSTHDDRFERARREAEATESSEAESAPKASAFSLKGVFGSKKSADVVDHDEATHDDRYQRERLQAEATEAEQPVQKSSTFSGLKGVFGGKKNAPVEEASESTHDDRYAQERLQSEPEAEPAKPTLSGLKGMFGKKKAPVESADIEPQPEASVYRRENDEAETVENEQIYKSFADEVEEISSKFKNIFGKKTK